MNKSTTRLRLLAVAAAAALALPACSAMGAGSTSGTPNNVQFIVDTGPGVDARLANKIFQPFVTTRARGTGLGLAVVQKIVVSHNGRVTLQAEPEAGARFTITLPLHSDTALH